MPCALFLEWKEKAGEGGRRREEEEEEEGGRYGDFAWTWGVGGSGFVAFLRFEGLFVWV